MADLFKVDKNITVFDNGNKKYYFFKGNLTAIQDYNQNKVFIERKELRKRSLLDYIKETYYVKYEYHDIVECYDIRNHR